jgi:uncharacterized protein (DUF1330 family)
MSAYLIVDIDIKDPQRFEEYREVVPGLIEKHGGKYLVRSEEHEVLEGNWTPARLIIFQFPDRASIHNLFKDPDYQPMKKLRHETASTNLVVVDGIEQ